MKQALISPNEVITNFDGSTGQRVAQVEDVQNIFDVGFPLYWRECSDAVVADQFYFDPATNEFLEKPVPPPPLYSNAIFTVT